MSINQSLKYLRYDLPAGLIVFLVAVPLCLGIALASGAPLFSGILAGIVGGIVVAAISGASLGVSGPAAGLAVVVLNAIADLGSFQIFLSAVVLAGVIQVTLGFLRVGNLGYFFPSSVIRGMLSAIGIIIVLKQIPHAIGYDKDYEGSFFFEQADGHNTLSELFYMMDFITPGSLVITFISLLILILWEQKFMRSNPIFKVVQGPLVVVVVGILVNRFALSGTSLELLPEHLVGLPVASTPSEYLNLLTFPDFSGFTMKAVWTTAIVLAIIASLETLLSVEAIDKLDPEKRITPTNRELKAQGIGNIVSGLIGGLPITQVIVRSSVNLQSGGKTKVSIIVHGLLLLVSVLTIPEILNMVPYASLASILFLVGLKLANLKQFKEMYSKGHDQFIPFAATITSIVFTDLLTGIIIGMCIAIVYILYSNFKTPYIFNSADYHSGDTIRFELTQEVSFLNKGAFIQSFAKIPNGAKVCIDASNNMYLDKDVEEIIQDFLQSAQTRNINVEYICDKSTMPSKPKPKVAVRFEQDPR